MNDYFRPRTSANSWIIVNYYDMFVGRHAFHAYVFGGFTAAL